MRIARPFSAALACALTAALAACGGGTASTVSNPPAPRLSDRVALSGNVPHVRPADFRTPIAAYRRHVRRQLAAMEDDVAALRGAVAAGDLAPARAAWLRADARYESIGAAYGAFGALDARIDGTTNGLPGGVRSPAFTGMHRVELALWGRRSTADAAVPAARLAGDVATLHARVRRIPIEPLDYALRAHEVLEDALSLTLSGEEHRWSGDELVALSGDVRGTDVVLGTLRALVARRNPQALARSEQALGRLRAELARLRRGGALPRWGALGQRERERVDGLTADAAEQLAFVPELLDPRPPRRPQDPFSGTEER